MLWHCSCPPGGDGAHPHPTSWTTQSHTSLKRSDISDSLPCGHSYWKYHHFQELALEPCDCVLSLNWSIKHMESLANSLITLSANIHLDELSKYKISPHHEAGEFLAQSNQHTPLFWPQLSLPCLELLWISWRSAFPFILFFGGHCLLFSKHIKMSRMFLMRQILVSSKNCFIILCYWEPPCLGFTLTCCLFQINSLDMLWKKWPVSNRLSGTKWRRLMLFS